MSHTNTPLDQLQVWYLSQCNGDWEHTYGVAIGNIDNPGWSLDIDLRDTSLAEKKIEQRKFQDPSVEDDWWLARVENEKFVSRGGPRNLTSMIDLFLEWANK